MGAERVELGAEGAELGLKRLDLLDDARDVVAEMSFRERPLDPVDRVRRRVRRAPRPENFEPDGAGLTAKQIAELLGVKTNAVEVALHRALGRLKVLLDPAVDPKPGPVVTEKEALDA